MSTAGTRTPKRCNRLRHHPPRRQPLAAHFALFRPIRIWPTLDKELTQIAARYKKIIVIEGSDGQYANVVERMLLRRVERVPLLAAA